MNVIVIGRSGQLARGLADRAWPEGVQVRHVGRPELDAAQPGTVAAALDSLPCDVLINAAAYTDVDRAESEAARAMAVNRDLPAALARWCAEAGAAMVHISTDYVFDGEGDAPFTESDPIRPISVYGVTKALGEEAVRETLSRHVILRTSWVYDARGRNFPRTMLRLGREREELRVVDDQHGSPTAAVDLADAAARAALALVAGEGVPGTYHYAGEGVTTWFGFAEEIFRAAAAHGERVPVVRPIPTEAYPTPATRPRNSRLNCAKIRRTYGIEQVPWTKRCRQVVAEILQRGADE